MLLVGARETNDGTGDLATWRPPETRGPRASADGAALARKERLFLGAAEPAVVLGDRLFESRRDLRRRLRADGRTLGVPGVLGEPELELVGEVHELLELGLDEVRVARDAAAQRLRELAHGPQLFLRQACARSSLLRVRRSCAVSVSC